MWGENVAACVAHRTFHEIEKRNHLIADHRAARAVGLQQLPGKVLRRRGVVVWGVRKRADDQAQIGQRIGPPVMRPSLNTMMLAEGVDRITLRSIMGHASEEMTQRYAGIGDEAKAEAIELVRPALRIVRSVAAVEAAGAGEAEPDGGARVAS